MRNHPSLDPESRTQHRTPSGAAGERLDVLEDAVKLTVPSLEVLEAIHTGPNPDGIEANPVPDDVRTLSTDGAVAIVRAAQYTQDQLDVAA